MEARKIPTPPAPAFTADISFHHHHCHHRRRRRRRRYRHHHRRNFLLLPTDKNLGEALLFEMAWCTRRSITLQRTKLIPDEQLHPSFRRSAYPERRRIFEFNDEPSYSLLPLFAVLFFPLPVPGPLNSLPFLFSFMCSSAEKWADRVCLAVCSSPRKRIGASNWTFSSALCAD